MKKNILYIVAVTALLFAFSGLLFSQSSINGIVKSGPGGTPIQGAAITIGGDLVGLTDATGKYSMGIASGTNTLGATYNGNTISKTITFAPGDNWMNFWFDPPALPSDFDGNYYDTVNIGTQTWMAENLKVTHFKDGTNIPNVTDNIQWRNLTASGYCWYNNDFNTYKDPYGALYNGYTVANGNLCPTGWHVPNHADWRDLVRYLGSTEGGKLKETGTTHWQYPNTDATNEYGFTALPGGYRDTTYGNFVSMGLQGFWWSYYGSMSNIYCVGIDYNHYSISSYTYYDRFGASARCMKNMKPTLTSTSIISITQTSAQCWDSITNDGGLTITARGVCWSTNPNPTAEFSPKTLDGIGIGGFYSDITNLAPGTTYYLRGYATNSIGTAYGNEISFTTYKSDAITDIEGNYYNIVTIGSQIWMAENLKTTKYLDGGLIDTTTSAALDISGEITPKYQWAPEGNENNVAIYGRLYTWYAITDSRSLCPTGWHVPTDAEWTILTDNLGGASVAGGKLKEAGTAHWNSPNTGATNESGFTALPGGYRYFNGQFPNLGLAEHWWSSTESTATFAFVRNLQYTTQDVSRNGSDKKNGISIRCLKDELPTVTTGQITDINPFSALIEANVTSAGGGTLTDMGVCWSTTQNPTIDNSRASSGPSGAVNFVGTLGGLDPNTTYYVRAYATNGAGTAYGDQKSFKTQVSGPILFNPGLTYGTVIDVDGNSYHTIQIGTQLWMAENLRTTKYNDGNGIPLVTDNAEWIIKTTPDYCWYKNDEATYKSTFGGMYNWYTISTGKLCPTGWHVPIDAEWTKLFDYLGGQYSLAVGKMKETGITHWTSPNSGANDISGFAALPGGMRKNDGEFVATGEYGYWWSSSEVYSAVANIYRIDYSYGPGWEYVYKGSSYKFLGMSIRCLNDILKPSLATSAIGSITQTTAQSGGNVTSDGGSTITTRGVCWSTSHNPTITLTTKTLNGTGIGGFSSNITGLAPGTTYFVRAYVTNSNGTSYGDELTFTTYNSDAITDIEGNYYNTIKIGTQIWMAENLKTTKFNDGTQIPLTPSDSDYCWFNYDVAYKDVYGAFYHWHAVSTNKLCPAGWRIPSYGDAVNPKGDWVILTDYLTNNGYGYGGSGDKIAKSMASTSGWTSDPTPGNVGNDQASNNKSGFKGLPAGMRWTVPHHIFQGVGEFGRWWSSTKFVDPKAVVLYNNLNNLSSNSMSEGGEYITVRCVKNPTVVTNTNDTGPGSLRNAIEISNSSVGVKDTIIFNIPGTGPFTIQPLSPLPDITDPVVINGYSQQGASAQYSKLLVQIDGTNAGTGSNGFSIIGGNTTIKGLVINRFSGAGIYINNSAGNIIEGNYLGTDITGTTIFGQNGMGRGIFILNGSSNIIGGITISQRNIISGNGPGISISGASSTANLIQGNYIGLDVSGKTALGNDGIGIAIGDQASANRVGGTNTEERNVVSASGHEGIVITGQGTKNNVILGNYLGTDYSGIVPMGNHVGVSISAGASNNQIGDTLNGGKNLVAYSVESGVLVKDINSTGNKIIGNSIYSNGGRGINLGGGSIIQNDAEDVDVGPNNLQNFPVLESITFDLGKKNVTISGYLESTLSSVFTLQFFTNKVGDNTGYGEGETYLGSAKVTTGSNGLAPFSEIFTIYSSWGDVISATATDAAGNTSEFAQDIGGLQNQIIPAYKWPFTYKTNADGVLRITDGSDIAAVDSAFRTWTLIPTATIDFRNGGTTTTKYASANDGMNLVTFTDDQFPFSPGIIAVAAKTLKLVPGSTDAEIIDADIVVNPLFARNDIGVGYNNPNQGTYDIQSLVTHEVGHVVGLLHSGVYNSSMFYILYPGTRVRSLEQDDKSWASYRYPKAAYATTYGSISGNIKYGYDGQPVAGALVLAINTSTKDTIHAYSDVSGDYLVPGLRPGSYNIYIEPLDGSSKVHKLKPGYISAYVYCNTVYTDYPGEFFSGPTEGTKELVDSLSSVTVKIGTKTPDINITTNIDLTGPEVLSVYPPKDTTNISVTGDIIIAFSEPVDQTSLTDKTCYIESGGIKHGVTYTAIGNSSNMIMLSPDSALKYDSKYDLYITGGVKDLRGNPANPGSVPVFHSSFWTTGADSIPPEITGTYPVDKADSVFVMEKVIVFFSKPMNRSLAENSFSLSWSEGTPAVSKKVDGSFTWDDENKSVTFIPSGSLKEGTKYTITLSGAATDQSNNHLTPSTFSFTTIPNAAPAIIYLGPLNLEQEVSINTPVVADFSEPIDTTSVNTSAFSLKLNGVQVPGKFEFLNDNSRVIFRPDADLEFAKSYAIKITTLIQDVSVPSLHMKRDSVTAFTTASKPTAPLISSLEPSYGTIGSKVVIAGKGFDPNPVKNTVKFNGLSAAITDATLTTLTTNVPLGALSGMVTVTGINGVPSDNSMYFGIIPQSDNPCENFTSNAPLPTKSTKDVSVTPDNAFAYVTNPDNNTVTVVDLIKSTVVKSIGVGKTPMKIVINSSGTLAYVTNFYSNDVSVINLATNNVIKTIKVGVKPYGITVTPDGKGVYVANYFSGTVSLIDTDPNSGGFDHVVANIQTGTQTSNVVTTPDGAMVLVTGDFGLKIIDTKPKDPNYNCVAATIKYGTKTSNIDVTPDAAFAIVSTEEGNLLIVNLHPDNGDYSDAVAASVPMATKVSNITVSGDNMFVYVTATDKNEILVYKLTQGGTGTSGGSSVAGITLVLHSTITGIAAPEGLVINSKADKLYVINGPAGSRQVTTIQLCCGPVDPANVIGDLITSIQNMINNGSIPASQGKDLINKLNKALQDLQNKKTKNVINDLNTFTNQVQAYIKGHKISAAQGQPLIDNANILINQLKGMKSAAIGYNFTSNAPVDIEPVTGSKLGLIYPNPSNESFIINYEIAENNDEFSKVMIRVYDYNGELVRTLVDKTMQTGCYSAEWNGNFDTGNSAPGGTYFVHFRTANVETIKKIILIR